MKPRRKKKQQDKGAPKWMVTFSDLMTLILVFFVLLFSMSQINVKKFEAIAESFRSREIFDSMPSIKDTEYPSEQIKTEDSKEKSENPSSLEKDQTGGTENSNLEDLMQDVKSFLETKQISKDIRAEHTERGVVLTLQEQILFNSGDAKIIEAGKPFLDKVRQLLDQIPNHVKVEGHTDNRPISTFRYPSNWELSAARASSVIRYLTKDQQLEGSRFTAVGYADTRPEAANNSPENWNKNRRVEIVILDPTYNDRSTKKASSES